MEPPPVATPRRIWATPERLIPAPWSQPTRGQGSPLTVLPEGRQVGSGRQLTMGSASLAVLRQIGTLLRAPLSWLGPRP